MTDIPDPRPGASDPAPPRDAAHRAPPGPGEPTGLDAGGPDDGAGDPPHVAAGPEGARPARPRRGQRRRDKIVAEIERNRRGEYTVPTWVLVLILLALVGGWLAYVLAV